MSEKEFGLVLQKPGPSENFCVILSPQKGLSRLYVFSPHTLSRLHPGTLLTFSRWQRAGKRLSSALEIDLIATNPAISLPNLQWLSLIWAVTSWLAQEHQEAQGLFMHLCACLSLIHLKEQNPEANLPYQAAQTAYLCSLLYLLGKTPPTVLESVVQMTLCHTAQNATLDASCTFHQKFLQTIGLTINNSLALQSHAWINQCIVGHPLHQRFASFFLF